MNDEYLLVIPEEFFECIAKSLGIFYKFALPLF